MYVNNTLIKPYLHNNITTVAGYYYKYSTKQHVSALLGHHQAYKTVVLVKVQSVLYYSVFKQYLKFEKGHNNIVNHVIPQVKTTECTLTNTTVL